MECLRPAGCFVGRNWKSRDCLFLEERAFVADSIVVIHARQPLRATRLSHQTDPQIHCPIAVAEIVRGPQVGGLEGKERSAESPDRLVHGRRMEVDASNEARLRRDIGSCTYWRICPSRVQLDTTRARLLCDPRIRPL